MDGKADSNHTFEPTPELWSLEKNSPTLATALHLAQNITSDPYSFDMALLEARESQTRFSGGCQWCMLILDWVPHNEEVTKFRRSLNQTSMLLTYA